MPRSNSQPLDCRIVQLFALGTIVQSNQNSWQHSSLPGARRSTSALSVWPAQMTGSVRPQRCKQIPPHSWSMFLNTRKVRCRPNAACSDSSATLGLSMAPGLVPGQILQHHLTTPWTAACRRASPPRPTLMVGDMDACQAAFARLQATCAALLHRQASALATPPAHLAWPAVHASIICPAGTSPVT